MRIRAASVFAAIVFASCTFGCSASRDASDAASQGDDTSEAYPAPSIDRPPGQPSDGSAGGTGGGHGDDDGKPSDVYPAPHMDAPTAVSRGGPVLGAPRIVPVTFPGDAYDIGITLFTRALAASDYWALATAEYGVGPLDVTDPVHEPDGLPAKINDAAIETLLTNALDGSHPEWPAADGNTVYAFYFPSGVAIDDQRWGKGCIDFAGYHWEVELPSGAHVPYIVIPRCPSFRDVHGFDVVTATSSHELIEAATDPFPDSAPAYSAVDGAHEVWAFFPFSEIGDMCDVNAGINFHPKDLDYLVQRVWSNVAAAAHHDPCSGGGLAEKAVPAYFNSVPVLREDVTIDLVTKAASTKGVRIPVGESKTIDIDLFSDAPTTGPWTVTARDVVSLSGRYLPQLSFEMDRTQGVNGEKLHLTIHALREGQSGGAELMLVSTLGERTTTWFGFVAN